MNIIYYHACEDLLSSYKYYNLPPYVNHLPWNRFSFLARISLYGIYYVHACTIRWSAGHNKIVANSKFTYCKYQKDLLGTSFLAHCTMSEWSANALRQSICFWVICLILAALAINSRLISFRSKFLSFYNYWQREVMAKWVYIINSFEHIRMRMLWSAVLGNTKYIT